VLQYEFPLVELYVICILIFKQTNDCVDCPMELLLFTTGGVNQK
jgi:hypothetical protein